MLACLLSDECGDRKGERFALDADSLCGSQMAKGMM